ncbi:MAG: ComEA family DNA-binding protein [Flavisolibacter sp.]
MFLNKFIKSCLSVTKKDRVGVLAFFILTAVIYCLPYLFAKNTAPFPATQRDAFVKAMDTLTNKMQKSNDSTDEETVAAVYQYEPTQNKNFTNGELFVFDPNVLTVEGWQRLGLNERISKTIEKYRSKGGKFFKPEDLKKIWGLPGGFYERVKNYIAITSVADNNNQNHFEKPTYTKPEKKVVVVNINEADTATFIALPGIGSKLAFRIVNFRDKLGGFYTADQVGETYGLPDSTFQKIKPYLRSGGSVKKLNVNTATKDDLKSHPYIKWGVANAIVEYRNQHGAFKSLEDLKNIALIDEKIFEKIVHYLTL